MRRGRHGRLSPGREEAARICVQDACGAKGMPLRKRSYRENRDRPRGTSVSVGLVGSPRINLDIADPVGGGQLRTGRNPACVTPHHASPCRTQRSRRRAHRGDIAPHVVPACRRYGFARWPLATPFTHVCRGRSLRPCSPRSTRLELRRVDHARGYGTNVPEKATCFVAFSPCRTKTFHQPPHIPTTSRTCRRPLIHRWRSFSDGRGLRWTPLSRQRSTIP